MNLHPHYQDVYAGYSLTPQSDVLLAEFSKILVQILQEYPLAEQELKIQIPSQFHLTADYKGDLIDVAGYEKEISMRKKELRDVVVCDGVGFMPSKTTGNCVIFMLPYDNTIPFHMNPGSVPHVTAIQVIEPDFMFRRWIETMEIIDKMYQQRMLLSRDQYAGNVVQLDTSKVTVWGKQNGEKKVLLEI